MEVTVQVRRDLGTVGTVRDYLYKSSVYITRVIFRRVEVQPPWVSLKGSRRHMGDNEDFLLI